MTEIDQEFWHSFLQKRMRLKGELDHLKGKYIALMSSVPKDERKEIEATLAQLEAMDKALWDHADRKLDEG